MAPGHESLRPAAKRVQEALRQRGMDPEVVEFPRSTRTAQEAAEAVGTTVGQIAKSLVFMAGEEPILIIASGKNRVSEEKVGERLGLKVRKAGAQEVREATGYAIGGVPPVGHTRKLRTLIDEDLMDYPEIYAAAGTPYAVFRLTPRELVEITEGQVCDLKA